MSVSGTQACRCGNDQQDLRRSTAQMDAREIAHLGAWRDDPCKNCTDELAMTALAEVSAVA
jgi:hypothetical protein